MIIDHEYLRGYPKVLTLNLDLLIDYRFIVNQLSVSGAIVCIASYLWISFAFKEFLYIYDEFCQRNGEEEKC